jgi:hypothetical protein
MQKSLTGLAAAAIMMGILFVEAKIIINLWTMLVDVARATLLGRATLGEASSPLLVLSP